MHHYLPASLALLIASGAASAVDINRASEMELDAINGIGPALSSRVLKERDKAEFRDWRDLLARVKGLGPVQAARLSAQGLTVAGAPFDASLSPPPRKHGVPAGQ